MFYKNFQNIIQYQKECILFLKLSWAQVVQEQKTFLRTNILR